MPIRIIRRMPTIFVLLAAVSQVVAASDLADALMRGEPDRLPGLLAEGTDIDATQADGTTALHWAAFQNDADSARLLLEAGAAPNPITRTGMTPLLLAAEAGNAEIAQQLLDAGADVQMTFANGETPLMMAARTGNTATIDALLNAGAEIDATEDLRGTTALMWAAAYSNPQAVSRLIERGADPGLKSTVIAGGRGPYLAPTARSRITEFIRGTGLRGDAVDFDVDEIDDDTIGEVAARAFQEELAREITQVEEEAEDEAVDTSVSRENVLRQARQRATELRGGSATSDLSALSDEDAAEQAAQTDDDDDPGALFRRGRQRDPDDGGLTALILAVREGDLQSTRILVEAGADVNQTSEYGWTPLLTATQNRYYSLGLYLLDQGADPNIATMGGWNPLYIATDNRNIEGGDYPTRRPDMDHLDFIRRLLAEGADPNQRMASSTETRTIFTHQWLREEGATPFLRAAQSGDLELINLLLESGADPSVPTDDNVTPLMVASGIAWVEGVTFEWSREQTLEVMRLLIELGADVNVQDTMDYRTAAMGAAHKGHNDGIQLLADNGADLSLRDIGSRDSIHTLAGVTWQAIDYADGLVRVGVQSAISHLETAALIRELMLEQGHEVPPEGRTLDSICVVDICR